MTVPDTTSSRWPVLARGVFRRHRRAGALWGAVFMLYFVASVSGYASAYPTQADRVQFARTFLDNAGIAALFGRALRADTPASFAGWRSTVLVAMVGSIWALLLATKALRAEEEQGRAELVLAAPLSKADNARGVLAGLAGVLGVVFAIVAVTAVVNGLVGGEYGVGDGLWYALEITAGPAMFVAVGALLSQVAPTRARAATLAGVVFGASYLVRMVADVSDGLRWLAWLSPLGWAERMQPLTDPDHRAIVPIVVFVVVVVYATLRLAAARDVGGALLSDREEGDVHPALLRSPARLAVRLARPADLGWAAGLAVAGLVFGLISKTVSDATASNSTTKDIFARFGTKEVIASAYLGITFLFLAAAVAMIAAAAVGSTRAEEADGRVDHILSRPVSRTRWLTGRLLVTTAGMIAIGLVTGIAGWAGAASQDVGVSFASMLAAGLNLVPIAVLVLGIGTLAHGVLPRAASPVAYALIAWSFLVEMIGALVKAPALLLDTSLLHHVAPAPAVDPRWDSALVMVAIGVLAAAGGVVAFRRRDLAGA